MAISTILNFENQTNGVALTLSSPWTSTGSTTEFVASSTAAMHGALGISIVSATSFCQLEYPESSTGPIVLDMYFNIRNISATLYMMNVRNGAGAVANWRVNANRTVTLRDGTTAVTTSGATLSLDTWYRASWMVSSSGQELRIYAGDATTASLTLTGAVTAYTHDKITIGPNVVSSGSSVDFDTIRIADDWLQPAAPLTPTNTFDGVSDATAITIANSGGASGTAFDGVSGTVTANTSAAYLGDRGMTATLSSSTESYAGWFVYTATHYVRMYFKTTSGATPHNARMIWSGTVASSSNGWDVRQIVSTELLAFATRNTTRLTLGKNGGGTGALDRNTWYRVEAKVITGASGSVELRLYDTASNTLLDSGTWSGAIDAATFLKYGLGNGVGISTSISVDELGYSDTNWLGAATPPAPVVLENSFDGVSDGTTITTVNSGSTSGDAFDTVAGSTVAHTASKYLGATGMTASLSASTESYVGWDVSGVTHYGRFYFKTPQSGITHNARLLWAGTAGSTTDGWDVRQIVSSEIMSFATRNTTRLYLGINGDGTGALIRDTWYRVEAKVITGASGSVELRLYDAVSNTLLDSDTWSGAIDATTLLRYGLGNGVNISSSIRMDSIGYSDTDWLGSAGEPTGLMKVWNGSAWVAKEVKVWNGSEWVTKPVKRWDGSSWNS